MTDSFQLQIDIDDLPSPPGVAVRLLQIFDDPDASMEKFAEVISTDAALSAKVIEYCNSPLIGHSRQATDLQQAMVMLGLKAVKIIALSFSLMQTDSDKYESFDLEAFWKSSFATALVSKKLFEMTANNGEEAFLAGLMLNIGRLALFSAFEDEFTELLGQVKDLAIHEQSSEIGRLCQERWGKNQYQIGSALLNHWNFPEAVIQVLELHDPKSVCDQNRSYFMSERIAFLLCDDQFSPEDVTQLTQDITSWLEISEEVYAALFDSIISEWNEYARLLNLDSADVPDLKALEKKAKKTSRNLSLGLQAESQNILDENDELKSKVMIDSLTGLKNRHAYDQDADPELERARRKGNDFSFIVADIDHFKHVNDTYGHAAGDAVLIQVAKLIKACVRAYDSVYRFGGEEFVMVISDCNLETAKTVAERIRKTIEQSAVHFESHKIQVTISQGCITIPPENCCSLESFFKVADALLYSAKKGGRNRVCAELASSTIAAPANIDALPPNSGIPMSQ